MNSTVGFAAHFGLLGSQETEVSHVYIVIVCCYCSISSGKIHSLECKG